MRAPLAGILLAIAAAAAAQPAAPTAAPAPPPAPIGADAIWTPPDGFLAAMHKACDKPKAGDLGACFVAQMGKAGASAAAVDFARRTENQGYLREFRATGVVDIAFATYPYRANENAVCFLVNGQPPMIDVDDPSLIKKDELLFNRVYDGLAKKYPNISIFPARRTSELAVMPASLRSGGQQFRVDYSLLDGCHACARVGSLRMAYDFDVNGRYVGAKVSAVRALNH
jgi:hypothetical protein